MRATPRPATRDRATPRPRRKSDHRNVTGSDRPVVGGTEAFSWGSHELGWPADPFRAYARARAAGPVSQTTLPSGRKVWVITGFAQARAALADPRLSTDGRRFLRRWWGRPEQARAARKGETFPAGTQGGATEEEDLDSSLAEHMLSTDPPDHTRLRRLVSEAFTLRRIESLRPRVVEIATELADGLEGRREPELMADFAFPLPIRVICELLGVPTGDEHRFRSWFRAMIATGPIEQTRQGAQRAAFEVAGYLSDLVAAKRAEPADDVISALVEAREEDAVLSEPELISMIFLLLLAGHETTVNLIGNGMTTLLTHPDQLALLRTRRELVPQAIEELLRFDGPVQHPTLRFSVEPLPIGDVTIPAGEIVLVALGAANRDPSRFRQADRLEVTRHDGPHLAFGHGPHFCLGAPLARLEGQVALSLLLERFPNLRLAGSQQDLVWRDGIFLRGLETLPVVL